MNEVKPVIIVLAAAAGAMIACLAAATLMAPQANPVILLSVMGGIMLAVLAMTLGRGFFVRFNLDKSGHASGELGSTPDAQRGVSTRSVQIGRPERP